MPVLELCGRLLASNGGPRLAAPETEEGTPKQEEETRQLLFFAENLTDVLVTTICGGAADFITASIGAATEGTLARRLS